MSHHTYQPLAILHPGHGGKSGGGWDPGVVATVAGIRIEEAVVNRAIADRLQERLSTMGWATMQIRGAADYGPAHEVAGAVSDAWPGQAVYIQVHINGGTAAYPLVEHDARSKAGAALAAQVATELGKLPEATDRAQVWPTSATSASSWIRNAHATIDGIWLVRRCVGLLVEAGFAGQPRHLSLWTGDGPARVAECIARGLAGWLDVQVGTATTSPVARVG